jgi:murein DD-endopeptidase MepM/ murein hydrolase activator NlpD
LGLLNSYKAWGGLAEGLLLLWVMFKWAYSTLILISLLCFVEVSFADRTLKTNHTDVNLWSEPNRTVGEPMGLVERYEEVQELESKTLPDGSKWSKIKMRRWVKGRATNTTGWVDRKYFVDIRTIDRGDEQAEGVTSRDCQSCKQNKGIKAQAKEIQAHAQRAGAGSSNYIQPVSGIVKSSYGYRRHPILGYRKLHTGTDISGNSGRPVKASKSGIVSISKAGCSNRTPRNWRKGCNSGKGNNVTITHADGSKTNYWHLSPTCRLPKAGSAISQGQVLGCVGSSGFATGPHLHFEIIRQSGYVDPLRLLARNKR